MARMNIKKYCSKVGGENTSVQLLFVAILLLATLPVRGEKASFWKRITPNVATVQYAGNIAMASAGVGWEYGKDKWLTEALIGYVPRYRYTQSLNTFTLRQHYTPWRITLPVSLGKGTLRFSPLSVGILANIVLFDGDFWTKEPTHHYGGNYYRFSTRVRFAFSLGERLSYDFPESWQRWGEGVELYYEFSAHELGIISAVPNDCIHLRDILSLGIGARWKF